MCTSYKHACIHTYVCLYGFMDRWMDVIYIPYMKLVVNTITICILCKLQLLIFSYTSEEIWLPHCRYMYHCSVTVVYIYNYMHTFIDRDSSVYINS